MVQRAALIRALLLIVAPIVAATNISNDNIGFDRKECYSRTLAYIDGKSLAWDDEVFFRDDAGQPLFHAENLTLTLPGCMKLCGPKQGWYWDIGSRLSIWLIPILLLLSNVELSPLDKRRFTAIIHLLGDPIDSIWSLVDKIDAWGRCYRITERYDGMCDHCKRIVATVLAGFEEIEGPRIKSEPYFDNLLNKPRLVAQFHEWRKTAIELADSRTDEFYRTCLAILLYMFQLIASFVKEVGGGSGNTVPGGRIATGVFLSWLMATVLLSNTIGGFPSRRTCYDVISRFAVRTGRPFYISHSESVLLPGFPSLASASSTDFFQSLGWSGAIYTFRPWKLQNVGSERRWPTTVLIALLSVSPICIGMTGGFFILWFSLPIGLTCRHTWLLGIFFIWFVSAFITWITYSPKFATGKYHWHFILGKDCVVAASSITVLFLSACGLFNSCYCFSGSFYYRGGAHVPLNGDPFYELNNRTIYPLIVGVSICLQLLVFAVMAIIWRQGLKLLRWSDHARGAEWGRIMRYEVCDCMHNIN